MHDTIQVAAAPLAIWSGSVLAEWLDYNGHMTEHRYLQVFGESSDALYERIGVNFGKAEEGAFYTLETHIRHIAECRLGAVLRSETEILGYDEKRLHLFHRLYDSAGRMLATGEHLAIHVAASKACPANPMMQARISAIFAAQRELPMPEGTGAVLKRPLANRR